MKKYKHQNIVEFFDSFVIEDDKYIHICIIMEYIEGYSLKEVIELKFSNKF